MTLFSYEIFDAVARQGSFNKAAQQLHLTPSAISHAVSTMEAECGFPLFTRTKSGVTMTAAAENLLPAIQRLLASSESRISPSPRSTACTKACCAWGCSTLPA